MAVNQEYKEYRVNDLPVTGYAGDRYYLNVGGGKFQTYIISDALTPVREAGQEFIECDTVDDLRNLDARQIWAIQNGYYKGVTLNGYYNEGDTPAPIQYYLSDTAEEDDGGSVFEVGGIKLKHEFVGGVDILYYGAIENEDFTDIVNYAVTRHKEIIISSNFKVNPVKSVTGTSFGGGVQLQDDNILRFINGAYLYIDTQTTDKYVIINLRNTYNVTIIDGNVIGDVDTHEGDAGEYGFGYYLASCYNPKLINCKAFKCWGDGVVVTSDNVAKTPTVLGEINNGFFSDNRRQGLSIISWDMGVVNGGVFEKTGFTKATNPSFGIDIEPNADGRGIINVVINSPVTRFNKNGGILLTPSQMTHETYDSKGLYNVVINNHMSYEDRNYGGLRLSFAGDSASWNPLYTTAKINGAIKINDSTIQKSSSIGIKFDRWGAAAPKVFLKNITIIDCNTNLINDRALGSAVTILPSRVQDSLGIINIDTLDVLETREENSIYTAINVVMYAFDAENINLKNINIDRVKDPSGAKVFVNKSKSLSLQYDVKPTNIVTSSSSIPSFGKFNGEQIIINANATVTLPSANVSGGYEIEFVYGEGATAGVFIAPLSGDVIDILGFVEGTSLIHMSSPRDRVTLKVIDGKWKVLDFQGLTRVNNRQPSDINTSYINNPGAPTEIPKSGGEFYFDSTNRVWYKSIGVNAISNYIPLNPKASTTQRGDVLQLAASADTATEAAGETPTKAEFDALLAELRDLKTKMRAGSAPILSS